MTSSNLDSRSSLTCEAQRGTTLNPFLRFFRWETLKTALQIVIFFPTSNIIISLFSNSFFSLFPIWRWCINFAFIVHFLQSYAFLYTSWFLYNISPPQFWSSYISLFIHFHLNLSPLTLWVRAACFVLAIEVLLHARVLTLICACPIFKANFSHYKFSNANLRNF